MSFRVIQSRIPITVVISMTLITFACSPNSTPLLPVKETSTLDTQRKSPDSEGDDEGPKPRIKQRTRVNANTPSKTDTKPSDKPDKPGSPDDGKKPKGGPTPLPAPEKPKGTGTVDTEPGEETQKPTIAAPPGSPKRSAAPPTLGLGPWRSGVSWEDYELPDHFDFLDNFASDFNTRGARRHSQANIGSLSPYVAFESKQPQKQAFSENKTCEPSPSQLGGPKFEGSGLDGLTTNERWAIHEIEEEEEEEIQRQLMLMDPEGHGSRSAAGKEREYKHSQPQHVREATDGPALPAVEITLPDPVVTSVPSQNRAVQPVPLTPAQWAFKFIRFHVHSKSPVDEDLELGLFRAEIRARFKIFIGDLQDDEAKRQESPPDQEVILCEKLELFVTEYLKPSAGTVSGQKNFRKLLNQRFNDFIRSQGEITNTLNVNQRMYLSAGAWNILTQPVPLNRPELPVSLNRPELPLPLNRPELYDFDSEAEDSCPSQEILRRWL